MVRLRFPWRRPVAAAAAGGDAPLPADAAPLAPDHRDDFRTAQQVRIEFNVPHRMLARVFLWVMAFVTVLWALENLQTVISWVLLAGFLATAAEPGVRWLQVRGFNRAIAIPTVLASLIGMLVLLGWALLPQLLQQADSLVRAAPGYVRDLQRTEAYEQLDVRFGLRARVDEQLADLTRELALVVPSVVRTVVGGVFAGAMVAIMSILMLVHGGAMVRGALGVMSTRTRQRWEPVVDGAYRSVAGFVSGTVAVAAITGTMSLVMFLLLDLPTPLPLAAWVTLWAFIPIIGSPIGTIPAVAIAWFDDPWKAVVIVLVVVVYQQLESAVISPTILGKSVQVSPLLILVSVLAGAHLAGMLGAIMAVPLAGTVQIVATEWLRHRAMLAEADEADAEAGAETGTGGADPVPAPASE